MLGVLSPGSASPCPWGQRVAVLLHAVLSSAGGICVHPAIRCYLLIGSSTAGSGPGKEIASGSREEMQQPMGFLSLPLSLLPVPSCVCPASPAAGSMAQQCWSCALCLQPAALSQPCLRTQGSPVFLRCNYAICNVVANCFSWWKEGAAVLCCCLSQPPLPCSFLPTPFLPRTRLSPACGAHVMLWKRLC